MFKMKLPFCVILVSSFVLDSSESKLELDQSIKSEYSLVLQRLEAQEFRVRALEKSREELKEHLQSLKTQVNELKQQMMEFHGAALLTPPLRGLPRKQGDKGEKGDRGSIGPKGERGQVEPEGKVGESGGRESSGPPRKDGKQEECAFPTLQSISSCSLAMEFLSSPRSKNQTIYPHGNGKSLEVLCDFETDGGGWTLIQKRSSGPKDEFQKNWIEYKNGFGSVDKNFWLGLDNIHALTQNRDQELKIELEDFEGVKRWAKYSNFSISDASDFYRLTLDGFSGDSTLNDSMTPSSGYVTVNGMRFSTKDKDNDNYSGNCAVKEGGGGGWWFSQCGFSNLNGLYFEKGETVPWSQGIWWYSWTDTEKSLAKTEMKIRTRK